MNRVRCFCSSGGVGGAGGGGTGAGNFDATATNASLNCFSEHFVQAAGSVMLAFFWEGSNVQYVSAPKSVVNCPPVTLRLVMSQRIETPLELNFRGRSAAYHRRGAFAMLFGSVRVQEYTSARKVAAALIASNIRSSFMPCTQGDLALLDHPASQELLQSKIPARLAYVWTDGTPRVVPIWFHWNGSEFVMGTPPKAPKLKALAKNPKVALTIDDNTFPHKVLLIRGTAKLENISGIVPEYEAAAARYFDAELAKGWLTQLRGKVTE